MAKKITGADADYVRRFKALAGDTSKECGVLTVRKGLINKYQCRLCGEIIPFKNASTIDKLTGYCQRCMRRLNEKQRALDGDPEAIKAIETREAAVNEILGAMKDGRVQELFGDEDDDGEDADLDQDDDPDDEDDDF